MVRFIVCYDTPADPNAFERHYQDIHVPLTVRLPGLRRYTLGRNAVAIRGGAPYYLVAELDWDDMASLRAAFESAEGRAAAEDVPLLAPTGVRSMVVELAEVALRVS